METEVRRMDMRRRIGGCHKNSYKSYRRYNYPARCMYSDMPSPLSFHAVRSFGKTGGVNQLCDLRLKLLGKFHKKIPPYCKNQSAGGQTQRQSSQRANPWVQPTKAHTERAQPYRERVTISTPPKEKKEMQDLRIQILKNNILKRIQSEKAASCGYKNKRVEPDPNTTAASTVASGAISIAVNDLRLQILSKRDCRKSKADDESRVMTLKQRPHRKYDYSTKEETGVTVNSNRDIIGCAKQFKNRYNGKHNSITSGAIFQRGNGTLKSDYSFK